MTVEAINPDGSVVSFARNLNVAKWVDVPTFLDLIFGPDLTKKVTTTWVWDGDTYGGNVFGNGGWMNNTAPGWWCVSKTDIDDQCAQKNYPMTTCRLSLVTRRSSLVSCLLSLIISTVCSAGQYWSSRQAGYVHCRY